MPAVAKHRHPAEGGYQRGDETRERIVIAALRLFGERGFEGASTRDIATSAGVNAPALHYYFDGKEGVYIACVEYVISRLWEHMSEVVAHGERVVAENVDDETLIDAYCDIQARWGEFMFTAQGAEDWRRFMSRQQAGEGPAVGIRERFRNRLAGTTSAIVGRLLGRPANDEETMIRLAALSGQLSLFQMAPRLVLTALKWDSIDAEHLASLTRVVRAQTAAVLHSIVAVRDLRRVF
jgi:TetR/AcrR family transcriptional regulator, regulator of cefoperazone and chloramphenicol sensitivity